MMKSICCSILLAITVYAAPGVSGEALRSDLATKVKKGLITTIASRKAKASTLLLENQTEGARNLASDSG